MTLSRALILVPLAALAGCGSSVVPSADQAHTMACRSYVLTIGNDDTRYTKELIQQTPYSTDDIRADPTLAKVRSAAASSGATAGLSDGDFKQFRKIVATIDGLSDKGTTSNDGTREISEEALLPLADATAAVHTLCY